MESPLQQIFRLKHKTESTKLPYRLSCQALAQHFGILMDEEVLNGIGIAVSSGSLRERPASDF